MRWLLVMTMLAGCGLDAADDTAACGEGFERNDAGNCALADDEPPSDDGSDADGGDDADDYEGDEPGECSDGADNDRDSLWDCDDPDCAGSPDCSE